MPAYAPPPVHAPPGPPVPAPGWQPFPGPGPAPGGQPFPGWSPPSGWSAPARWQPPAGRPGAAVAAAVALLLACLGFLVASGLVPVYYTEAADAAADFPATDQIRHDVLLANLLFFQILLVLTVPAGLLTPVLAVGLIRRRRWARTLTLSLGSVLAGLLFLAAGISWIIFGFQQQEIRQDEHAAGFQETQQAVFVETAWMAGTYAGLLTAAVLATVTGIVLAAVARRDSFSRRPR